MYEPPCAHLGPVSDQLATLLLLCRGRRNNDETLHAHYRTNSANCRATKPSSWYKYYRSWGSAGRGRVGEAFGATTEIKEERGLRGNTTSFGDGPSLGRD